MSTRNVDATTKQVSYELGVTEPLTLKLTVELLEVQCETCYKEQGKAISTAAAATVAAMALRPNLSRTFPAAARRAPCARRKCPRDGAIECA